ncbi:MAG: hypothetical protein WKG00_01700 [Polyangiaceae bacterium]
MLGVSAVASLGTAPGVAIGVVAQAGLTYGIASASVEGRADLPSSKEADRGTVRARLYAGSLVPCIHPRPFVFGCVVGTLGALHGEGHGVPDPRTETSLFGALGGRIGARLPLVGALAARATADIGAVLTPPTLELSGAEVWASPPVYGALAIGAEVRLP